jgi:hypothetical protein
MGATLTRIRNSRARETAIDRLTDLTIGAAARVSQAARSRRPTFGQSDSDMHSARMPAMDLWDIRLISGCLEPQYQ